MSLKSTHSSTTLKSLKQTNEEALFQTIIRTIESTICRPNQRSICIPNSTSIKQSQHFPFNHTLWSTYITTIV
jgi:hypothetical protein